MESSKPKPKAGEAAKAGAEKPKTTATPAKRPAEGDAALPMKKGEETPKKVAPAEDPKTPEPRASTADKVKKLGGFNPLEAALAKGPQGHKKAAPSEDAKAEDAKTKAEREREELAAKAAGGTPAKELTAAEKAEKAKKMGGMNPADLKGKVAPATEKPKAEEAPKAEAKSEGPKLFDEGKADAYKMMLAKGFKLTSHGKSAAEVFVQVIDDGQLLWGSKLEKSGQVKKEKDHVIALKTLQTVEKGRTLEEFKKASSAKKAVEDHCFSVVGKERTAHFEAKDQTERDTWVESLHWASAFVNKGNKFE